MKVVAVSGSPRKKGNSERLLDAFLEGAERAGAEIKIARVADMSIAPCRDCGECERIGRCVAPDDHPPIADEILHADVFVLSAPVYFSGFPGMTKNFIDRFQGLWARRYLLGQVSPVGPRGYLLSVGGARSMKNFDGLITTFHYLMLSICGKAVEHLVYPNMDSLGAIDAHRTALLDAREAGFRAAVNKGE